MARIRTIKPQFWTDESIVEMPYEFRLLYIGMWNFADDDGFLENKPKQIKLQVFPGDDVNVTAGIRTLVKLGMLEQLTLDGTKVLRIKGWKDHQVISRPRESRFKEAYADYQAGRTTHGALHALHGVPAGNPSGREGNGKEGNGKDESQVSGGGHLSSGDVDPTAPDFEPWRCDQHQGVDVKCWNCAEAKKNWRAKQGDSKAEAKRAKADERAARAAAAKAAIEACDFCDDRGYTPAAKPCATDDAGRHVWASHYEEATR